MLNLVTNLCYHRINLDIVLFPLIYFLILAIFFSQGSCSLKIHFFFLFYFRLKNDLFEQEYCCAKIGQIYGAEQQDRYYAVEQHKPLLQYCFPENELHSHNQQDGKNNGEKQRDQEYSG